MPNYNQNDDEESTGEDVAAGAYDDDPIMKDLAASGIDDVSLSGFLRNKQAQKAALLNNQPNPGALALADFARGIGAAMSGGNGAQAAQSQISGRQTALQTRLKALDSDPTGKILENIAKNKIAQAGLGIKQQNADTAEQKASSSGSLSNYRQQSLGLRAGDQASRAGEAFDKDPILLQTDKQRNQIALDLHTLNTAKIVNPQILNEVSTGMANAISGGRSASLGAVHMQEINNLDKKWTDFLQFINSKPEALNQPETIQFVKDTLARLDDSYANIAETRALSKANAKTYQSNPEAQAAVAAKVQQYRRSSAPALPGVSMMGDEVSGGAPGMTKDVIDYATSHNITPQQALQIKLNRTGGK